MVGRIAKGAGAAASRKGREMTYSPATKKLSLEKMGRGRGSKARKK